MRTPTQKFLWALGNVIVFGALIALGVVWLRPLGMFIDHGGRALDFPYTLNYGEGPLLDQAWRLARGDAIYAPLSVDPPYTITNYPPLYPLLQAPFVATQGAALWYGRLIALISAGVTALFLGFTARAITRDWSAGVAAGALFLAIPYTLHWSALARTDMLALALSMIGLYCVAIRPRGNINLILAILFMGLAAYTRQTYLLAAPLAACAWLWGIGERARAMTFAAWFAAAIMVVFAILIVLTDGGIFFHIVTANVNALSGDPIRIYAEEWAQHLPILAVAGALVIIGGVGLALTRRDDPDEGSAAGWMAGVYVVGALGGALTIAKIGSDVNYLLELSAAACLAAGVIVGWLKRVPLIKVGALGVVALQIVLAFGLSESKYYRIVYERTTPEQRAGIEQLLIRAGDVSTLNGRLPLTDEHMALLPMLGLPLTFQPFELSQLAAAGVWDETAFVAAMRRGDYPIILLYQPMRNPSLRFERWTPNMLRAINDVYRADGQYAETTVYVYVGE
jgi:hypothetical protein